jgi:hypothetical protein
MGSVKLSKIFIKNRRRNGLTVFLQNTLTTHVADNPSRNHAENLTSFSFGKSNRQLAKLQENRRTLYYSY